MLGAMFEYTSSAVINKKAPPATAKAGIEDATQSPALLPPNAAKPIRY
jgi:hypothetical protein